jgi:mannose-6-phosphate isomerase
VKELEARQELTPLEELFMRLAGEYADDVGCFVVFLLNCFSLKKGEAIYLAANVPHAYLFGDGVECMACSDNVVRAGLTPKFKDVETLCSMLDYTMRSADENKLASARTHLSREKAYLTEFRPSVDEFSIQQIHITQESGRDVGDDANFLIPKLDSGSILLVVESEAVPGRFSIGEGRQLEARAGLVYFIDANTDVYFTSVGDSSSHTKLLAYRAYCDIKA